ncbi:hypothetical protein HK102_011378 [Quaeritorhiza haematococci]|nr:hypothetical protein HK102_011378 [Quaeritorhiza haematococci]
MSGRRRTRDEDGILHVYDVVFHPSVVLRCRMNEELANSLSFLVFDCVEETFGVELDPRKCLFIENHYFTPYAFNYDGTCRDFEDDLSDRHERNPSSDFESMSSQYVDEDNIATSEHSYPEAQHNVAAEDSFASDVAEEPEKSQIDSAVDELGQYFNGMEGESSSPDMGLIGEAIEADATVLSEPEKTTDHVCDEHSKGALNQDIQSRIEDFVDEKETPVSQKPESSDTLEQTTRNDDEQRVPESYSTKAEDLLEEQSAQIVSDLTSKASIEAATQDASKDGVHVDATGIQDADAAVADFIQRLANACTNVIEPGVTEEPAILPVVEDAPAPTATAPTKNADEKPQLQRIIQPEYTIDDNGKTVVVHIAFPTIDSQQQINCRFLDPPDHGISIFATDEFGTNFGAEIPLPATVNPDTASGKFLRRKRILAIKFTCNVRPR